MGMMVSQITSLMIVYSTVYSGAAQRKHQSSASLAFVRGIHRELVNSLHKWPVRRKMFPFDDVIMWSFHLPLVSIPLLTLLLFPLWHHWPLWPFNYISITDFGAVLINSSPTGQNDRHFTNNIFRCIFVNEMFCILIKISRKFAPKSPVGNYPALI